MKKHRKHYTPEEKVAILRRHLLENEPISKLRDELGLLPTALYRWQKEFFENGAAAFEQKRPSTTPLKRHHLSGSKAYTCHRCLDAAAARAGVTIPSRSCASRSIIL